MSKEAVLFTIRIVLAALLFSCTGTSDSQWSREHAVVKFNFDELMPATVRIAKDGNIRWVNEAPDSRGFVVFAASIAHGFTCGEDLHPYFRKIVGGFQSLPITSFEPNRVQLPCPLAPGTYDYEVAIVGTGLGATDQERAEQKLQGTIVVE